MTGEASTRLADGTLIRWHQRPVLAECWHAGCQRPHVDKATLNVFATGDDWWQDYSGDDPAIRGALGLDS